MSSEKEFLKKIEQHKGILFKISKMYVNDFDDQKDLYQEIVYQAWKSYPNFLGASAFSTWLYRIALNTAIVFFKNEKKASFIQNSEIENLGTNDEVYDEEKDRDLQRMYHSIQQLSAIDKALIFYYLEGFSGREIGRELGISEVNARVKLNRAKTKLKEIIAKQNI